ncbi:Jerky -like [Araneus ventricosus]|uniref:Jerky-like n=1 Tax=Araneus ventricosus TaxID=182803 RepID=A0A4Y2XB75_ARAVE|nr:Jerky -like [Araneus ventricosus]
MKDRVTILGCTNASGSHRVKLTLVGKSKKPRCFKNIIKTVLHVHYMHQESAWMNSISFSEWFHDCFVPEVKKNLTKLKLKKAILLMDNAPDHPDVETTKAENIACICMPPNTTAILQPMDQGVIESMKRRYRKQLLSKFLFEGDDDDEEAACSIVEFWKSLTLKDCVYMINEAWEFVPDHTLKRSWRNLAPYLESVDQSNDSGSVTVTELKEPSKKFQAVEIAKRMTLVRG